MYCYIGREWDREISFIVICKDKEQAEELLKIEAKRISEELETEVLYNNTIVVDYGFIGEVEDILPQEVARLKETPNNLGGCDVYSYEEYMCD